MTIGGVKGFEALRQRTYYFLFETAIVVDNLAQRTIEDTALLDEPMTWSG
jgi:hypothetical protein